MISVIIPTLLYEKDILIRQINTLLSNNDVEKIVIIDNTNGSFKRLVNIRSKRLEVCEFDNIFVNPAWNFGIRRIDTEFFLLLNDDVLFDNRILEGCLDKLIADKDVGCILAKSTKSLDEYNLQVNADFVFSHTFVELNKLSGYFIVGRKELWKDIPPEFKIWFGDQFIYLTTLLSKYRISLLINPIVFHKESSTTKSEKRHFMDLFVNEKSHWSIEKRKLLRSLNVK